MFNSIRGKVTQKLADALFIETGGIEWEISCPALDMEHFPRPEEEGRVWTWLYHREDQMKLFGFSNERRRDTFLELIKVDGVGPRGALKIMGGIGQEELEAALEAEDTARLEAVPGLGKKTAQKMILALRGKIAAAAPRAEAASPWEELAEALAEMGYDKKRAVEALAKAAAEADPALEGPEREQLLFRRAILVLSGA